MERLIKEGLSPVALVCNPDRPKGRKKIITPPPTKVISQKNDKRIDVLQPEKIDNQFLDILQDYQADFYIVCAYSKILPTRLIKIPKLGVIGVHPSLLPKLRGSTPIQSSILHGLKETGTTLYLLDDKVDHGKIISSFKLQISYTDTYQTLSNKIAELAGELLVKTIPKFLNNETTLETQEENQATYTNKFSTGDGYVDFKDLNDAITGINPELALLIHRKIRALNPDPGVYTFIGTKRTRLIKASLENSKLKLEEIQFEGKKPMRFSEYQKPLF